jgi:PhnB protein
MQPITPYLNFAGNAQQALDLYAQAFNGEIVAMQRFGEMPPQEGKQPLPPDGVLHATFKAGDLTLMVSDLPPGMNAISGNQLSLSLNFDSVAELTQVFNTLSEGGEATMPPQDTFWGAHFAMLTDAFGIQWLFNHDYPVGEDKNFPV